MAKSFAIFSVRQDTNTISIYCAKFKSWLVKKTQLSFDIFV